MNKSIKEEILGQRIRAQRIRLGIFQEIKDDTVREMLLKQMRALL